MIQVVVLLAVASTVVEVLIIAAGGMELPRHEILSSGEQFQDRVVKGIEKEVPSVILDDDCPLATGGVIVIGGYTDGTGGRRPSWTFGRPLVHPH